MIFFLLLLAGVLVAGDVSAQSLNIDFGEGQGSTARLIQMFLLVTIISLAPSILVMITSFTRFVVVLSFLRTAMGVQQVPPNSVLISLALFLTLFVMQPVFDKAWENGLKPMIDEKISEEDGLMRAVEPFREFMLKHTRPKDLELFMELGKIEPPATALETPLKALIPAFMISELRRAFEIGFLLFLPFLIIDMVVSSILMSMGMMMLPPPTISLPFKII
ncbi:MAG: flagellar biosynthetic protein FliP, partial [Alphaproteobacteria bacterium]|nr:flagellar biosynthetic protein FliP [Alphaproteobacteria bacterium]